MDKNMKEIGATINKMETEYGLELMGMFMMVNLLMGVKKVMEFLFKHKDRDIKVIERRINKMEKACIL